MFLHVSVILFTGWWYPSMHCRWYPSMPCSRGCAIPACLVVGGCLLWGGGACSWEGLFLGGCADPPARSRRLLLRTVRILLECILVLIIILVLCDRLLFFILKGGQLKRGKVRDKVNWRKVPYQTNEEIYVTITLLQKVINWRLSPVRMDSMKSECLKLLLQLDSMSINLSSRIFCIKLLITWAAINEYLLWIVLEIPVQLCLCLSIPVIHRCNGYKLCVFTRGIK